MQSQADARWGLEGLNSREPNSGPPYPGKCHANPESIHCRIFPHQTNDEVDLDCFSLRAELDKKKSAVD